MSVLPAKIDIRDILANHFNTLVDDRTERRSIPDIGFFYGLPLLLVAAFVYFGVRLSDDAIPVLTNALAILAGLLFNLLVLLHGFSWPKDFDSVQKRARRLIEQVYSNVAYSIIVALTALVPLTVAANYPVATRGRMLAGTLAIWLVVHFALTMIMVLKRMHVMLQGEITQRHTS